MCRGCRGDLVTEGILSDAQIETIIYAGEAHQSFLAGHYKADESFDRLDRVAPEAEGAVQFRKGYFLGDGTGCGKGRQAAGILLDNWLQGRRRALWISKSDKLLEDAQRDWSALGQEKLQIVPLTRTKQGQPIKLRQGHLVHHLRDLAQLGSRRQELPPPANPRLARPGFRRRDPVR